MRTTTRGILVALAAGLAVGLAACGGDGNDGDTSTSADTPGGGDGRATVAITSFPDYMDPALSYSVEGWQSLWLAYTPLLTYKHSAGAEGAELIPGLAQALPTVSPDGKVYTLKLRAGLKYSDGTAVKASDFEHTIKRVLNLESGGLGYFERIAGAEQYVDDGRASADISGIETNDETGAITITITAPDGAFPNVLALPFAGVVPGDTPFSNQTKDPPPGVGPLKIENLRVKRGYDLVRDEGFAIPGIEPARLSTIRVEAIKDRRRQTQDTIANKLDVMVDPPAPDQLGDVRTKFTGKRYAEFPTNSTYFFFLNHRVAPFDDKRVRQAVNFAVDKRSLARLFAGLLEPGCNFLPRGVPGYEQIDPCPYGDADQAPDLDKARALVKAAGAEGEAVKVWGNEQPETESLAEYLADVLNQIGLDAKPQIVSGEVYLQTVGSQRTKAQAGFASFSQDFPHPSTFFSIVNGASIQSTNNPNFGNVEDPQIDAALAKADPNPDLEAVADDYAAVDRRLVEEAHVLPYGNRKLTVFLSERMNLADCTVSHPVYGLDLTKLCLK